MESTFKISLLTEDSSYILNRIVIIFTRRRITIESITTSGPDDRGTFQYLIVLQTTYEKINRTAGLLVNLIGVTQVAIHQNTDLLYPEADTDNSGPTNAIVESKPEESSSFAFENKQLWGV